MTVDNIVGLNDLLARNLDVTISTSSDAHSPKYCCVTMAKYELAYPQLTEAFVVLTKEGVMISGCLFPNLEISVAVGPATHADIDRLRSDDHVAAFRATRTPGKIYGRYLYAESVGRLAAKSLVLFLQRNWPEPSKTNLVLTIRPDDPSSYGRFAGPRDLDETLDKISTKI